MIVPLHRTFVGYLPMRSRKSLLCGPAIWASMVCDDFVLLLERMSEIMRCWSSTTDPTIHATSAMQNLRRQQLGFSLIGCLLGGVSQTHAHQLTVFLWQ